MSNKVLVDSPKLIDLRGKTIGELTIIDRGENIYEACGTIRAQWDCVCSCGDRVTVKSRYLHRRSQISCKAKPCREKARATMNNSKLNRYG